MRFTRHRRLMAPVVVAAAVGLALTACTGDVANEESADVDCGPYETYGAFDDGTEVDVYGTILDPEAELLNQSWADFESCTGIDIVYEGSDQYEEQLNVRIEGGNPPDLGITPQPGLIARLAQQGDLLPAPESVADNVAEYWSEDWAAYGTVDGTLYGAPLMANIKGWVWYSPALFEENGWAVPETLDELAALTEEIRGSGAVDKPWCVGFASGVATGWPGTDWVEDFVLRMSGPEVYDQWTTHEIPFNDAAVSEAFDAVGEFIRTDENVNGGLGDVRSIATTDFGDAGLPIMDDACAMHHQASFYEGFWPEGTTVAEDGDVWAFMLPGTEAGANAVTGGGEIVAAFSDADEVVAVQTYLSSPEWANSRVSLGGVISANTGLNPENAGSALLQESVALLQDPNTTFRFDGSDVMPAAVGSGTFWTGMVDWIGGKSTADTLDFIEASWPQD